MDLSAELANGHRLLGYAVFLAVLASVVRAAVAARGTTPYSEGLPRLAGLLLALQFVYGLLVYVQGGYWSAGLPLAVLHPLFMLGGVALAGISTARAKEAEGAGAWAAIARFQGIALVLVLLGIGAASAG